MAPRLLLLAASLALAACADPADRPVQLAEPSGEGAADGEVSVPAGPGASGPRLALGADGAPILSWVQPDGDGHRLQVARWTGSGWGAPVVADEGTDWFVNWADTPGVVRFGDDAFLAHTLVRRPDGESPYAYDIGVRLGGPDGRGERSVLHSDGVAAEHGFVSAVPFEGRVALIWLDGRNQGGGAHGHHSGDMTLRSALLDIDGTRSAEAEIDARTCDCCPTALARTDHGLVAAYRDRSDGEVRDVAVARWVDGAWTAPAVPHADGWRIEGCPVNGPALAAQGDRVALAWYTEAGSARVQLAVSDDGGATWGEPARIDGGAPLGRVGVALLADGRPAVVWLERNGERARVQVRTPGAASRTVATVSASRASGIPHVVALGRRALVAWTDPEAEAVRSAVVSL